MPPRPSLNQRSNGSSQAGTRGNELNGRGPGARNRNTSYAADPPTDRGNSLISTSEQIHNTSPQSHELASEERGPRSRNNAERDGLRDPGNHKHKLNQAITEVLISSFKRLKSDTDSDVYELHRAARSIPRLVGPFINIRTSFINGSRLASTLATPPEAPSELTEKEQAVLDIYKKIIAVVPGLEEQVKWMHLNDPSGILELATFLDQSGNKGRSDDCSSLREDAISYVRPIKGIPGIEDIPEVDRKAKKDTHGFCHPATARLLCPRHLRDEFDRDREGFSRDVQNGNQIIIHDDWPSFLYPEDGYNPDAIDEGLLHGPFLVSCYRHVFTGARTAMKATPGKAPGKKCVAELYDMTDVTAESIAYTAILCRHVLNGKESWCTQDGNFHSDVFFKNILDLFDNEGWAEKTLTWWTNYVFGDDPRAQENTTPQNYQSGVSRLAAQHAACREAAASQSASDD